MKFIASAIALAALLTIASSAPAIGDMVPICKDNMETCTNLGEKNCAFWKKRTIVMECQEQKSKKCWTEIERCKGGCASDPEWGQAHCK